MTKELTLRIDETVSSIRRCLGQVAASEIVFSLPPNGCAEYQRISRNIALGTHFGGNVNQRHALRALLMCHQLFIRDPVLRDEETAEIRRTHGATPAPELWRLVSNWFTEPGSSAATVVNRALQTRRSMPPYSNNALRPGELRRGEMPLSPFNCYNAVVFWAFQGGCISLRWIFNYWWPAFTLQQQTHVLLTQAVSPLPPLDPRSQEYEVAPGNLVVMQRPSNPLGHTVMSAGGGFAISMNGKSMFETDAQDEPTLRARLHAIDAIRDCNHQRCHEISIRFLWTAYYTPAELYTPVQHPPFWLGYAPHER